MELASHCCSLHYGGYVRSSYCTCDRHHCMLPKSGDWCVFSALAKYSRFACTFLFYYRVRIARDAGLLCLDGSRPTSPSTLIIYRLHPVSTFLYPISSGRSRLGSPRSARISHGSYPVFPIDLQDPPSNRFEDGLLDMPTRLRVLLLALDDRVP